MAEDTAKINIEEFNKFSMFAGSPTSAGRRPRLAWGIRDGSPRITVFTNDPNDKVKYGIISAPMNPETFFGFLDLFYKTANGENNVKYKIENWTAYKDENGKQQDKTLLSEVWFGKDETGICWISLIAPNRPKLRFNFLLSDYHRIFKHDGNPFTDSEASVLQTNAVIKALREIYVSKMNGFKPPYDGPSRKNYSNSTSPSSISNTVEEDIPF